MEHSALTEILGVEKQIRADLDAGREQASHWLENVRREIDQAHQADLARLRAAADQRRAALVQAARERAAAVVQAAEAAAREQARVDDDELKRRVLRHIAVILPGGLR